MRSGLLAALVVTLALARAGAQLKVARFKQNPLVTTTTSASLGANVNGPTVFGVCAVTV